MNANSNLSNVFGQPLFMLSCSSVLFNQKRILWCRGCARPILPRPLEHRGIKTLEESLLSLSSSRSLLPSGMSAARASTAMFSTARWVVRGHTHSHFVSFVSLLNISSVPPASGFDSHFQVKTVLDSKLPSVNYAIASFWAEIKAQGLENSVTVVQGSEFGVRTTTSNFIVTCVDFYDL